MKKLIVAIILGLATSASAQFAAPNTKPGPHYLRLMTTSSIQTYQTANVPFDGRAMFATFDLAPLTHEGKDGTLIPDSWQNWLHPIDWAMMVGAGGNSANLKVTVGWSFNALPSVSTFILGRLGSTQNPGLEAFKRALDGGVELPGNLNLGFALGYRLAPQLIDEGHWQSFRAMFPNAGLGPNLFHASCASFSSSLRFGPKLP